MSPNDRLVRERRYVILFQLAVLGFILAGLFSTVLFNKDDVSKYNSSIELTSLEPNKELSPATELNSVTVRAKSAIVWDVTKQRALYIKNDEAILPIASITKLMTSLLAYELISDDKSVAISDRALREDGNTGLVSGESLRVADLKKLALIASSNDAAYALAASVGELLGERDPAAQFVAGMNLKAKDMDLQSLEFKNVTGLDLSPSEPGAVGSAKDVTLLMEHILLNYPEILEPTKRSAARVYNSTGDYHDVENTNDAIYAIPNLLGSKTGYTDLAGGNLTIAFDAAFNRPIIVTVLGSSRTERFTDVLKLVEAVRENIDSL